MYLNLLLSCLFAFSLCVNSVYAGKAKPPAPPPQHKDVSYGPHEPNVFDFWDALGDKPGPHPLVIEIHGGSWTGYDKSRASWPNEYIAAGMSYATINYRHAPDNPLPVPVMDAVRAVQFLRLNAKKYNIDPNRIALAGVSAGACTSMNILLHDDFADPKSKDPVLRVSSRVTAAIVNVGQTTIEPKVISEWLGPKAVNHGMICCAVGKRNIKEVLADYDKYEALYKEFSPINHVDKNDPPLFINHTIPASTANIQNGNIHSGQFSAKLKEKSDKLGHKVYVLAKWPSDEKWLKYKSAVEFLCDQFKLPKPKDK
ncbi:alpha/beta hydrolase fold domain-containing protein [Verrucomicrobiota bacterium]